MEDRTVVIIAVVCCIVGMIGAAIFHDNPQISWFFRPGLLYAAAIAWGLYLGLTYKPNKE